MKRLAIAALGVLTACSDPGPRLSSPGEAILDLPNVGQVKLTGPHTHKNLAVYIVHRVSGRDSAQEYLSLEEGLASGSVVLTEKQGVQTLEIENRSDQPVFIQGGDVVKGGQQDRTIYHSFVLPPKSGKVDVKAFCVEHGRWAGDTKFQASAGQLYTNEAKLAAREDMSQQKVWDEVAKAKRDLAGNAGTGASRTDSINEEYEKARAKIEEFEKSLGQIIENSPDAVGIAYGVNGNIDGLQVYESHALLIKMHKKVLRSCGAEAIAKQGDTQAGAKAPDAAACAKTMRQAVQNPAPAESTSLPADNRQSTRSSAADASFELNWKGRTVHVEAIKK